MPLFACISCKCVENTATSNYWFNKSHGKPINCSACDPTFGGWHGVFEKRSAVGMLIDDAGFLHRTEHSVPTGARVLGTVL